MGAQDGAPLFGLRLHVSSTAGKRGARPSSSAQGSGRAEAECPGHGRRAGTGDEAFKNRDRVEPLVAKKNQGPGIQSAAGLIRYFDSEEKNNIKIPPMAVMVFAAVVGVGVVAARIMWA